MPRKAAHSAIRLEAHDAYAVQQRHERAARRLLADGVDFQVYSPGVHDPMELNEVFDDQYVVDPANHNDAVRLAVDDRERIIAAMSLTAFSARSRTTVMIRTINVIPAWQRRRLGSVLLTTALWNIGEPIYLTAGSIGPETAPFVAQLGFTVLNPETPLPIPGETDVVPVVLGSGECWFYRYGPA